MRLIDADTLKETIMDMRNHCEPSPCLPHQTLLIPDAMICRKIDDAPTIDAVPVPCCIGDEIWYVPEWNKKPFKAVCHCISIDKGGVRVHLYDMDGDNATYPARCVFKSKEDAEKYIGAKMDGGKENE